MRILSLTILALIGFAGAAFAADQVPDDVRGNASQYLVSSKQVDAKPGSPPH
jgi:hypothetical protein